MGLRLALAVCLGLGLGPVPARAQPADRAALTAKAKAGDAGAMYALANSLTVAGAQAGRKATPAELAEALDWFKKAAAGGDVDAMFQLEMIYSGGDRGAARNPADARRWRERAFTSGTGQNLFDEGQRQAFPDGDAKPNPTEAARWFQAAANKGHAEAMLELGYLMYRGDGLKRDRAQGMAWLDKAVKAQPRNPAFLDQRCLARMQAGVQLDLALADCEAAVVLAPAKTTYVQTRALTQLKRGAFAEAERDFAAAKAKDHSPYSGYGRGLALLKAGKTAEGRAELAEASAQDPSIRKTFADMGLKP
ncbi:hypothetical protein BH11PSE2_BH11PSE2_14710 [soil metagenome]